MSSVFWTFPVLDSGCLVAVSPDREGLLLLNPTAAFIFQNPDPAAYASYFGVSLGQAQADVEATLPHLARSPLPVINQQSVRSGVGAHAHVDLQVGQSTFRIIFTSQDQFEELHPRLAALQIALACPPNHTFKLIDHPEGTTVYRDNQLIATEPYITGARAILLQELTCLAVPDREFTAILHAGAIGTTTACLILAGASFSGKSTLCHALMQSGLICYSDDSACLTPDYQVAGMPFALALRETPRFRPSNLSGASPEAPPVALIFVNYQSTGQNARLATIDTFEALLELQQSGFWIEHTKAATAAFIEWLSKIPRFKLTYSDLPTACNCLTQLLKR